MSLIVSFLEFGKRIEIQASGQGSEDRHIESSPSAVDPIAWDPAYFTCLLATPCRTACSHRHLARVEMSLDDEDTSWLVELLIIMLSLPDERLRCRAITMLSMIGGQRATQAVLSSANHHLPEVYWAAVSALRQMGHIDLLGYETDG